jgi:hypothetical protein
MCYNNYSNINVSLYNSHFQVNQLPCVGTSLLLILLLSVFLSQLDCSCRGSSRSVSPSSPVLCAFWLWVAEYSMVNQTVQPGWKSRPLLPSPRGLTYFILLICVQNICCT